MKKLFFALLGGLSLCTVIAGCSHHHHQKNDDAVATTTVPQTAMIEEMAGDEECRDKTRRHLFLHRHHNEKHNLRHKK